MFSCVLQTNLAILRGSNPKRSETVVIVLVEPTAIKITLNGKSVKKAHRWAKTEKFKVRLEVQKMNHSCKRVQQMNQKASKSYALSKYRQVYSIARNNMNTQHIETKQDSASTIQRKLTVVGLAVLPIVLAVYSKNGVSIQGISSVLSSGVFPIGFTLLSWGIAAKRALKLRK